MLLLSLDYEAKASSHMKASPHEDRVTRTLALHPGQAIVVDATVGDITIQGWDRADVSIEVVRTVPTRESLVKLPIVIAGDAGADLRVTATQPGGGKEAKLRADITMSIPRGAELKRVALFEGTLKLKDLSGAVSAAVNRGPIEASRLAGTIRLETSIGSIDLDQATLLPTGLLRLRTFNGNVRVGLAVRPADARILALTLNGTITSSIPLERKDQFGPRFAGAILGNGEPVLSVDVVTGHITIDIMK